MKTTTKFGAVLIGLMFLLSLVAVATPVTANNMHMVYVGPAPGSEKAGVIKIFETSDLSTPVQTLAADPSTGGEWFSLLHGTYVAKVYVAGAEKDITDEFTVSDTSTNTILYNIGTATNHVPVAYFTFTITGLTVNVDASGSSDADGDALTYSWNFGDSTTGTGVTASHTYAAAGAYTITLTVTDVHGAINSTPQTVTLTVASGDILVYDLNFDDSIAPGATDNFELELKNNATYDAEDVTATVIIHSIGANNDDLKTDIDFGTIDSTDRNTNSVDVTIPQDANDELYTVSVDLKWKDADGNHYTSTYTSTDKLEVVKEKHQISITSLQLDNTKYLPGATVQIAVGLLDSGANAETVALKVNSDIGASANSASFKMQEGDVTTQYLSFVVPDDAKAGKYYVVVTASYGSIYATKSIVLEVASNEQPTTVSVVQPTAGTGLTSGIGGIPAADIALAVVIILLIGAIGWAAKDLIFHQKARPIIAARARGK